MKFILEAFTEVARRKKAWAGRVDDAWKAGASTVSLEMFRDYSTKPIEVLAEETLSYFRHRANLMLSTYPGGPERSIDPHVRRIWLSLESGDSGPLFHHFACFGESS